MDYPGYGYNPGSADTMTTLNSAEAGLRTTLERLRASGGGTAPDGGVKEIGYFGHSIGTAAVTLLATSIAQRRPEWIGQSEPVGRLILSAPFTSIPAMARAIFGNGAAPVLGVLRYISKHRWGTEASIRALAATPVAPFVDMTILHGTKDEIVPVEMGRQLSTVGKVCGLKKVTFIERPEAAHNDILDEAYVEFVKL